MAPTFPRRATALVAAAFLGGCMDLDVANPNTPSIGTVYQDPASLETAVGTSFRVLWGVTQGSRTNSNYPALQLAALGEELTSADTDVHLVAQQPRVALDNTDAGGWTNRKPWYDLYEVIATTTDALRTLDGGLVVGTVSAQYPDGRYTDRARYFAKFMQGLSHVYIGLLFDQGFVTDETVVKDPFDYELVPSEEVLAHGIALLDEAIALAQAAQATLPAGSRARDTLPAEWINQQVITNLDLVRIANSYVARAMVYGARTPEERAAVDWQGVIARLDKGITTPFGQQADASIDGTWSRYYQRTALQTNARVDPRLVGPSDTTGAYQAWLDKPLAERSGFQVATPDRRVHGASSRSSAGLYFSQPTSQTMTSSRGTYMHSNYKGNKHSTTFYTTGFLATMTPTEMDFLRAEALIRLNRAAEALPLINKGRVANGKLPAVTVNGPPPGPSCVPRRDDGTCGDLMDALMYEKRMETFSTEPIIPYADARGWGKMLPGSLIEFPVHGRELETIGVPIYTFGGTIEGSAPANWPVNGKP